MALSSLLASPWLDDMLVWAVAILAALVAVVALANVLDMMLESDSDAELR